MALKSVRVIEMAGLAPAPFCGMVLLDFGADVIHVDKVGAGLSQMDALGHGKRSVAIDVKRPEGRMVLRRLCKGADVLIEPFRAGAMERLGLGPDVLLKDNPGLIYARLTGFGQTGPWSARAGHDINYVALSGLLSLFGREPHAPTPPINLVADFAGGGLTCALGILLALFERKSTGLGQVVDCPMVNSAAYLGSWLYRSRELPGVWGAPRGRNLLDGGRHFYDVYETSDGKYVSVGALEPQFYHELVKGLGLTEEQAPQFGGDSSALRALFAAKFRERTRDEWRRVFDGVDACVAPVLSLDEAAHARLPDDNAFASNEDGGRSPNPAPRLSRTPGESGFRRSAPAKGEHTREVLLGLGYDEGEVEALEREGAIECHARGKL